MSSHLLELDAVHTYIGQFHILQGVTLAVPAGGCTVLLGRNGAGKTTALRTIMGLLAPRSGRVAFAGRPIGGLPAHAVARLGIAYVPEDRGIFTDLTVEENLKLALRGRVRLADRRKLVLELFPDLDRFWHRKGGTLSGGQQQMLAIARALVSDVRLILLDEPSKGLAPLIVQELARTLNRMKREQTILLVEQNFDMAAAVGDGYFIIDDGRTVHRGAMADLAAEAGLQARYLGLGGSAGLPDPPVLHQGGEAYGSGV